MLAFNYAGYLRWRYGCQRTTRRADPRAAQEHTAVGYWHRHLVSNIFYL